MSWLIFVVITLLADSFRIFLDNYISDFYFKGRGSVSQKAIHGALQIGLAVIVLPFCGIDFVHTDFLTFLPFFISGGLVSLSGIPYYRALELDDSTNYGIFMQLAPVLYLILGWACFGETISALQLIAFVIILSAPILILKTTQKRSQKVRIRALFYAFLTVVISVVANTMFVKSNTEGMNFAAAMAIFYLGKGAVSMAMVALRPKWRRRIMVVMRRNPKKVPRLLVANTSLSMISDATYRLALMLAPSMAIASAASDSVEPIVIFFMGIVLTLIRPKFGREKLGKKSILVHLGATILVVVGVALIQL